LAEAWFGARAVSAMRHDWAVLIFARNAAIVMLLAFALTVVPGGGNAADALLVALTLVFLAAAALIGARFWRETSMTRDVMTDRQRIGFYGGLGAIALMIAGADELLETGLGTLAWLLILAGGAYLVFDAFRQANSY
jgi:hypothetical protein